MENNFKDVPKEVKQRARHVRLIFAGLPLFVVTSYLLYKRVIIGEGKRVQMGEKLSDGSLRPFSEEEIKQADENSLMTKFFGSEKTQR